MASFFSSFFFPERSKSSGTSPGRREAGLPGGRRAALSISCPLSSLAAGGRRGRRYLIFPDVGQA
ncbi:MAG: hypothetical protein MZV63_13455 [Marinilabiliales bacterium]|nr:hypothetical protein [Marinilabiliales bacterium]